MPAKPVNRQFAADAPNGPRPGSRYSTLARLLTGEILAGRYKVGQKIPTEAQLQQRFDVSRHTVREALRDLKDRGLVVARAGVGTVVRSKAPPTSFMQGAGTLEEIIQFSEATRMKVLESRPVIVDSALAEQVAAKVGQQLHCISYLRYRPKETVPSGWLHAYLRPEFADVARFVEAGRKLVVRLVEQHHGARIAEVTQQIVATALSTGEARMLKARAGGPALNVARNYFDAQGRLVMTSVGLYPADRFAHNTRFRIQSTD